MLLRDISRVLGAFLIFFSFILLVPLALALYDEFIQHPQLHPQPYSSSAFIYTFFITIAVGLLLFLTSKKGEGKIFRREGVAIVVIIWFITPLFGALPLILSGTLSNPFQAYFEIVSGFTTTGATAMEAKKYDLSTGKEIQIENLFVGVEDVTYKYYGNIEPVRNAKTGEIERQGVEAVSRALLFWRSLTQWLGGGGIVVLFVAILPALGVGGKVLMQSEVTGPIKDALTPRIKETALQLWKIYLGLTLAETALLCLTNAQMPLFDALTISFSTLSTGGFSIKNQSIGAYHNSYTDWIVILFMVFGSINFSLYFFCLKGKFFKLWDPELFLFLAIILGISIFAASEILGTNQVFLDGAVGPNYSLSDAIRNGAFQLISAGTSTGFVTVDYETWPYVVQALMLIVMFVGGMSGSTAGGIKVIRHLILFQTSKNKVESLFHPEAVRAIKIGNREIDTSVMINVLCFFFLLIALSVLATFLYTLDGIDPETAIGLVGCMFNNTGIAFRQAGPTSSCAFLSDWSLCLSSFWMIVGRLEVFAVLVLLIPAFWKQET